MPLESPMIEREYEYRLKAGRVQATAFLFGAGAVWFAYLALTNDRGLILWRLITFTQNGATIFYWVFAGLTALVCVCNAAMVARLGSVRQRIAFTKDGLMVPRSARSAEETLIRYENILDMKEFTDPDHLVLIRHREGEFELRLDWLPDERAFAEIVHNLALLARAAKAGVGSDSPEATQPEPT